MELVPQELKVACTQFFDNLTRHSSFRREPPSFVTWC